MRESLHPWAFSLGAAVLTQIIDKAWPNAPTALYWVLVVLAIGGVLWGLWGMLLAYYRESYFSHDNLAVSTRPATSPTPRPAGYLHGPKYWTLSEAVTWLAFGEPIKAKDFTAKFTEKQPSYSPERTSEFDEPLKRSIFRLLEAMRRGDIVAKGQQGGSPKFLDISQNHVASNVDLHLHSDSITASGSNDIGSLLEWDLPDYNNVLVEVDHVKKLSPDGGRWPSALEIRRPRLVFDLAKTSDGFRSGFHAWSPENGVFFCASLVGLTATSFVENLDVRITEVASWSNRSAFVDSKEMEFADRSSKPVNLNPGDRAELVMAVHYRGPSEVFKRELNFVCVGGLRGLILNRGLSKVTVRVSGKDVPAQLHHFALTYAESVALDFWRDGEHQLCPAEDT